MKLNDYRRPLHTLSEDTDNHEIVCNRRNRFVDFDRLKKVRKTKKLPYSPDMLFIHAKKKEVWFVEFKSSAKTSLEGKKKYELKRKALDGLIIFYEVFKGFYDFKKYYFVVYDKSQSYEEEVVNALSEKDVEFGLEELEGKFYEKVFTDSCETFVSEWNRRFGKIFI